MSRSIVIRFALLAGLALGALLPATLGFGLGGALVNERASVDTLGGDADAASSWSSVSDDGRFVAFASDASNLVAGDENIARDIFAQDRTTGVTELVSIATDGTQGNTTSGTITAGPPRLSADGRYVVFSSSANNLVENDNNAADDIFVRDRLNGTTELVSIDSSGPLDSGGVQGNDHSITPSISGDGRYVTFTSFADNLVEEDDNGTWDVFLHDRESGVTELLSVATDGTHGDASSGWLGAGAGRISADGRYVVFGSIAANLVEGDENGADDIFLRDRQAGVTERVSVSSGGIEGDDHSMYGDVSDDGRYVVFYSFAENLVGDDGNGFGDVFLHDRDFGTTVRVSEGASGEGDGTSSFPSISANGAFVIFQTEATNLVPGDGNNAWDILCYNIAGGTLLRVSVAGGGGDPDGASTFAELSADGFAVSFRSAATNLVSGDGNTETDIFVWGKRLRPPATPTPPPTPADTPTPTPTDPPPTPTPCVPDGLGDANGGGVADARDALFVLQFVAGLIASLPNPAGADMNADGEVTSIDAFLMLQFQAGLIQCLPV